MARNAISLLVDADRLGERADADVQRERHGGGPSGQRRRPMGWLHFDDFAIFGTDPAAFRRLAERCVAVAALLEAASSNDAEKAAS